MTLKSDGEGTFPVSPSAIITICTNLRYLDFAWVFPLLYSVILSLPDIPEADTPQHQIFGRVHNQKVCQRKIISEIKSECRVTQHPSHWDCCWIMQALCTFVGGGQTDKEVTTKPYSKKERKKERDEVNYILRRLQNSRSPMTLTGELTNN